MSSTYFSSESSIPIPAADIPWVQQGTTRKLRDILDNYEQPTLVTLKIKCYYDDPIMHGDDDEDSRTIKLVDDWRPAYPTGPMPRICRPDGYTLSDYSAGSKPIWFSPRADAFSPPILSSPTIDVHGMPHGGTDDDLPLPFVPDPELLKDRKTRRRMWIFLRDRHLGKVEHLQMRLLDLERFQFDLKAGLVDSWMTSDDFGRIRKEIKGEIEMRTNIFVYGCRWLL